MIKYEDEKARIMEKGNTVAAVNQTKCVADCEIAQSTHYWLNLTLITLMNLMK